MSRTSRTGDEPVLTPPEPVAPIAPERAATIIPVDEATRTALDERAAAYVAALAAVDPRSPQFPAKADEIAALGDGEIRASARSANRMLDRTVASLSAGRDSGGQRRVAEGLVELRRTVEDLDPKDAGRPTGRRLLSRLPFGNALRDFVSRYQSANVNLDRIVISLRSGQDELRRDNAAVQNERARLWEIMGRLQEYALLTRALDEALERLIAGTADQARADALRADVLFPVRAKHQDPLTQLAVCAQGHLALDAVRRNNDELIRGVDRAASTTVSALRIAVTVAAALSHQKQVIEQVNALRGTTEGIIAANAEMLAGQGADIQRIAAEPAVGVETLRRSFEQIYQAIDAVDTFRAQAAGHHEGDRGRAGRRTGPRRRPPGAGPRAGRRGRVMRRAAALAAALPLAVSGCAGGDEPEDGPREGVLRVLAGSELADLEPILQQAERDIGVKVRLEYAGTLDGVQQVVDGRADGRYEAVWFSSNRYLSLHRDAQSRLRTATTTMVSPVVLGVRQSQARRLGWDTRPPTWADIAKAAAERRFTYGMTSPAASNSGFSALVAVASALSGRGSAPDAASIDAAAPRLKEFFTGQTLTAGWPVSACTPRA